MDGDKNLTDPLDIANSFKHFFATIVNKYLKYPTAKLLPQNIPCLKIL